MELYRLKMARNGKKAGKKPSQSEGSGRVKEVVTEHTAERSGILTDGNDAQWS